LLFSLCLDETGTDGCHQYVTIGGAVATREQWNEVENAWERKLKSHEIDYFHLREFDASDGPYAGWSRWKKLRLEKALQNCITKNTAFQCAVSIHSETHLAIKRRMIGIRGFHAESDYSLCLRYLMFWVSEYLETIDKDFRLEVVAEHGPWAAGAAETFKRVSNMQGKWKPAKHAHRLSGFSTRPKGVLQSLGAADLIVGREHIRLTSRQRPHKSRPTLAHLLTPTDLEAWYEAMIKEKEFRRSYGNRSGSLQV